MQDRRTRNRTHYIHRLSYSNQERLAGVFVLLALALLIWLLISSEKTRNLFEEEYILYGTMDSIQAINEDTAIIVSGLNVGSVINVDITDDNKLVVTMSLLKKYQKLIRADSKATLISFKLAVIGKSAIEISIGSPSLPMLKDKNVIQILPSPNLVDMLEKVEPVLVSLEDSIQKVNQILSVIEPQRIRNTITLLEQNLQTSQNLLASIDAVKINRSIHSLENISSDTEAIIKDVRNSQGIIGSVIYDEKLEQDIKLSTQNLAQITEQLKTLLNSIQNQVYEIPELTNKISPLLDEADKTIKATQRIWPLSNAITPPDKQQLTTPEVAE